MPKFIVTQSYRIVYEYEKIVLIEAKDEEDAIDSWSEDPDQGILLANDECDSDIENGYFTVVEFDEIRDVLTGDVIPFIEGKPLC